MDIRIFNVCILIGWLMVLAGGIVINVGWGIAIAGALLLVLTLVSAYLAGLSAPKKPAQAEDKVA